MKSDQQIINEIERLEFELIKVKNKYDNLDQISCLSGEGNNLRKQINEISGAIKSLKWVIKSYK